MFFSTSVSKPLAVAVTWYIPGPSDTKVYSPAADDTVDCFTPVAWFWTTTLAPGIIAPVWSLTSPLIEPLPAWAKAAEVNPTIMQMTKMDRVYAIHAHRTSMATPAVKRLIQTFESLDSRM